MLHGHDAFEFLHGARLSPPDVRVFLPGARRTSPDLRVRRPALSWHPPVARRNRSTLRVFLPDVDRAVPRVARDPALDA
jgi:hypothetical protein